MDLLQQAVIFGTASKARLGCFIIVEFPDLIGPLHWRVECNVGIAMLRGPDDRLLAYDARDPDARMRLLHRDRPGVHHPMLVVRAFPAEWSGLGPDLDDQ